MPAQLPTEGLTLLFQRLVTVRTTPELEAPECPRQPVLGGFALEDPPAPARLVPVMGKPQQVKARLFSRLSRPGWIAAHQARLARVQPQSEPAEALGQDFQYPPGVRFIGEDQCGIIRIADELRPSAQAWLDLLFEPLVEYIVQVDIRQQR